MKKRYSDKDDSATAKKYNLCTHSGCGYRGTHSDSSGTSAQCGLHYYAQQGEDAIKDWQARNELAIVDVQRVFARLPKYVGVVK